MCFVAVKMDYNMCEPRLGSGNIFCTIEQRSKKVKAANDADGVFSLAGGVVIIGRVLASLAG